MDERTLQGMDAEADRIIAKWSIASLAGNLLPPPFDMMAVGAAFARMGQRLGHVYKIDLSWRHLMNLSMAMAKGVAACAVAFHVGSGLFKYVPGVNLWVALLVQPPIVAAMSYAVGKTFKQYYHVRVLEDRDLSVEEVRQLAEATMRTRLM